MHRPTGMIALTLLALAGGCALDRAVTDADEDGYAAVVDCDDGDAAIHPGAEEVCDGVDQDCDGQADEQAVDLRPFWPDRDHDGFGTPAEPLMACVLPPKHAENADDCDDWDPRVYPGAPEICDGVDQDCDGAADDGPGVEKRPWYADTDGDGFGDLASATLGCGLATLGWVRDATDCDDAGPQAAVTFPGAARLESATACMQDADGDGWGDSAPANPAVTPGHDCDDASPKARYTFPGSAALEGPTDCTLDQDGDGYGADQPAAGGVVPGRDCCDACPFNWQTFPGAAPLDSATACMRDHDGDGWGDASPGQGRLAAGSDCDDGDGGVHPGAMEVCDEVDQDCDGVVDDGVSITLHPDADGDGFGDATASVEACAPTALLLLDAGDCDDADPEVYPGAPEWCDGRDDDCDGAVDDPLTWIDVYPDADGDGWGDAAGLMSDCLLRAGFVTADGDCDDADAGSHPGATDIPCDEIDQDCDGVVQACLSLGEALGWTGEDVYHEAGAAVAGAGDVNGDGYDDLLVGAPGWHPSGLWSGAAYVVLGGPSIAGGGLADADWRIVGTSGNELVGSAVAGVGDVDGDGLDDLLVGAPWSSLLASHGGAIGLVLGSPSPADLDLSGVDAAWGGVVAGDQAGGGVAGAGDVNGDGLADLLMGLDFHDQGGTDSGAACLVLGAAHPTGGGLDAVDACFYGVVSYDHAGAAVAGVGDVDGDGLADMLVGAEGATGALADQGMAYLVLGGASPGDITLSDADAAYVGTSCDWAGEAVAGAGDVDGDGLDDMLIGAGGSWRVAYQAGAAYLVLGAATPADRDLSSADATFLGTTSFDQVGTSVAGAGDLDGDGLADMLIGAPGDSLVGLSAGVAYVVLGGSRFTGGTVALGDLALAGPDARAEAGTAVAGVGDVDGDGALDLLIGAPATYGRSATEGAAYLVLGEALPW
ncbi:MAG: MopE-related protein [Pseudomonadota bacterium]